MKRVLILFSLLFSRELIAQNSIMENNKTTTPILLVDSIKAENDTLRLDLFQSKSGRVFDLKSTYHFSKFRTGQNMTLTGVLTSNSAQITNLNVTGLTNLGNPITGGNASFSSLKAANLSNANPVFGSSNGSLTNSSSFQYKTVGAAAFHPEKISPIESTGNVNFRGQVSVFQNKGEVIGVNPSNTNPYRLIAPLEISLNADSRANNIVIENIKFCYYDSDGLTNLAAIVYRVNSSEGSPSLITEPMMGVGSLGNEPHYRCTNFKDESYSEGSAFALEQDDNSYYLSVFPIQQGAKLFESTPSPWSLDQPGLKLVHIIVQYKHQ